MRKNTVASCFFALAAGAAGCAPTFVPAPAAPDGGTPLGDAAVPADDASPVLPPPDAGAPPDAPPLPPGTFAIATWNLEQFPLTASTIDRVGPEIVAQGFDLVGVQEIADRDAFTRLDEMLPGYASIVSFESGFIRVGFLYREDRVEVTNIDRLFTDDDWAFIRAPLKADVRVFDETGATVFDFVFVVLHLKAQPDEESRMRRALAIQTITAWLDEQLATSAEQDYIVVGDFNDELTDPPVENVYTPLLDRPESFRFLTLDEERAGEHTYIPFRAMLDHVLVTSDVLGEYGAGTTEVLHLETTMSGYRDEISDHLPVVARFAL